MNSYIVIGIMVMLCGCATMFCYVVCCDDSPSQNIDDILINTPSPMRNDSPGQIEI